MTPKHRLTFAVVSMLLLSLGGSNASRAADAQLRQQQRALQQQAQSQPQPIQPRPVPQSTGPAPDPTVARDDVDSEIYKGTLGFVGYSGRNAGGRTAGDVALNYPNVDVHEVAKSLLGDLLGLNYAVDQGVTGTITVVTASPVAKKNVLPIFESALKAANLALVREGDIYTIVALTAAQKQPRLVGGNNGFGTEAVQLRFVNAVTLKKLLDPIVATGGISQVDPGRNLLMITGTGTERTQIRELIRQFDVNWMRGMSFALFVPRNTDSRVLAAELDSMINAPGSPAATVVRLLSLERLNAVLAISAEPQYLTEIKKWVEVLDRAGAAGERKLFVYRVQNGRAADLAKSLATAFGAPSSSGSTPTTPGAATTITKPITAVGTSVGISGQMGQGQNGNGDDDDSSPQTFGSSFTPGGTGGTSPVSQTVSIGGQTTPVTISSDETNNAILIYATPRQYAIVQDGLMKLDILPLQVMIDALIAEVTLTDDMQYGVQWYFSGNKGTVALSQGKTSALLQTFPGFNYFFTNPNDTVQAAINALSSVTTVNVVSAPKLMVLNNHTASLQVGDQVPVVTQSSVSVDTSGAPVIDSIEYRDTGVILKVTPRVNDSGLVLLDISQEVSDVAETSSSTINSPTIQQRKIASSIAVRDSQTIALGGLIRDNTTHGKSGLPVLSQIPIIGSLFGSTDNSKKRTELLVLLTPRVIRSPQDADSVTLELQNKLQALKPIIASPH